MLNDSSNEESKFAAEKSKTDSQTAKDKYNQKNSIKLKKKVLNQVSSLCDYSDQFILVTGDIAVTADNDLDVAFKNCGPFSTCKAEINDVFIEEVNHIYIAMPITIWLSIVIIIQTHHEVYGSLKEMKFQLILLIWLLIILNLLNLKQALVGKKANAVNNTNSSVKDTRIVVPLKFLSNFLRLLEISLINCKIYLELNWIEDYVL